MLPHQQRVIDEKKELDIKIEALKEFIKNNPLYLKLPIEDQYLLTAQASYMVCYSTVLRKRIERF